jgi:hypothetical protein
MIVFFQTCVLKEKFSHDFFHVQLLKLCSNFGFTSLQQDSDSEVLQQIYIFLCTSNRQYKLIFMDPDLTAGTNPSPISTSLLLARTYELFSIFR